MSEWQQVAIGVFVGMTVWRTLVFVGSSFMAVRLRRSRRVAWLLAYDKAKEEAFNQRIEREARKAKA